DSARPNPPREFLGLGARRWLTTSTSRSASTRFSSASSCSSVSSPWVHGLWRSSSSLHVGKTVREIVVGALVVVLVSAGAFVTRYGLFKAMYELWRSPRRKSRLTDSIPFPPRLQTR